jgi:hypothetical protein
VLWNCTPKKWAYHEKKVILFNKAGVTNVIVCCLAE